MERTPAAVAPGGWGFPPGYPLGEITAANLPLIPGLQEMQIRDQNAAIVSTLRSLSFIKQVKASHVAQRYDVAPKWAWELLQRGLAKGRKK